MVTSISMMLFSTTYLIIFGILIGITGQGSLDFSINEIMAMMITSAGIAVVGAVVAAGLANISILGVSANAGEFAWRGAIFVMVAIWASYFVYKMAGLMPEEMPVEISILFLGPPVVGILWGMFAVWHGTGG